MGPVRVKRTKREKKQAAVARRALIKAEKYIDLVPLPPTAELEACWRPVIASTVARALGLQVSGDGLSVTSRKGYRAVLGSLGVFRSTWYFEVGLAHLGATGHCRLGWAKKEAELEAPVGLDTHSYAYRDVDGAKVHEAWRSPYAEPFREGDVVGCLLHLGSTGRSLQPPLGTLRVLSFKEESHLPQGPPEGPPTKLEGSYVSFFVNGRPQGVAFRDLWEGTYYPAVSLFTAAAQEEGATATFNFGPDFRFPPPELEGEPRARPISEAAGRAEDLEYEEVPRVEDMVD